MAQRAARRPEDGPRGAVFFPRACAALLGAALLILAACAAPGEPTPRHAPVPTAITDLAAQQLGDGVVLTFTLPRKTLDGETMSAPPSVKIYREFVAAVAAGAGANAARNASVARAPQKLLYTIPAGVVDTYLTGGAFRFLDPLTPKDLAALGGRRIAYAVRTSAAKRKDSANSNVVALGLLPAPAPISEISARVTKPAIELAWKPPEGTSSGAPLPPLGAYHVYRAAVAPGAEAEALAEPAKARLAGPLTLLGVSASPGYSDSTFEFGATYAYSVRAVGQYAGASVESSDSRLVIVAPQNIFPPVAPLGLVAIAVPAAPDAPAHVELSWSISPEPDVAGYNVYRGEPGADPTARLNKDLLRTAVFRDMSTMAGGHYSYSVTAVDRAGNESARSGVVSLESPAEGKPRQP